MTDPRCVVITGATSGIGKAIALRFASLGDKVIVSGRNAKRGQDVANACKAQGGDGQFVQTDLADPSSITALADETTRLFGPAHVLVNSGGILQNGQRVLDQSLDEDEVLWRVN